MAERSTAAVDVADNSGDEPLTAEAGKATSDGVGTETKAEKAAQAAGTDTKGAAADTSAPELHSGHKLARRYRLEECVTRLDGFSSWRAVDEKLRRAVGVHVLPADHPRARPVLAAARSAALLGDPRFVQVLDAVEENDLVYVVHEWLPDATELTAVLASGPLEPHDAYQLVSQVSQAMAAAHREGLAHLRLNPGSV
ncbi:serine/threonine protein kinase, partial [Streptomyces sp. MCAF7]